MSEKEKALQGICSDCGKQGETLTIEEYQSIKDDLGMPDDEDLSICCNDCLAEYKK